MLRLILWVLNEFRDYNSCTTEASLMKPEVYQRVMFIYFTFHDMDGHGLNPIPLPLAGDKNLHLSSKTDLEFLDILEGKRSIFNRRKLVLFLWNDLCGPKKGCNCSL